MLPRRRALAGKLRSAIPRSQLEIFAGESTQPRSPAVKMPCCFTSWSEGLIPRSPTSLMRLEGLETAEPCGWPLIRRGSSCDVTACSVQQSVRVAIIDQLQNIDLKNGLCQALSHFTPHAEMPLSLTDRAAQPYLFHSYTCEIVLTLRFGFPWS